MPVYQQPLIDAISGIMSQDRQAKLDARQAAADERAARLSDLQYQTALDDLKFKQGERAYVAANMQPVTTYKDVANPAYRHYLDAHTPEALAYAQGNIPKKAVEGGWEAPIYEANPDPRVEAQLGYANGPAPAQTFQQATTTAPSYLKLAMDYAQQNGRPDEAMKLHDQVMSEAGKQTALLGTHQAGVDYYNRVMGTNVKFMGVDKDGFISFENNKDVYKMNPNTGALELFQQGEKKEVKGFDTIDLGDKIRVIPRDGSAPYEMKKAASPNVVVKMGQEKPSKVLPASALSDLADAKNLLDAMRNVKVGTTNTGPIAGRLQALANKFGMANSGFTDLSSKLQAVNNIMLKLRSGAAVTDQEYERFKYEMPTVNDDEKVFTTKMDNAIAYATNLISTKANTFEEGGYKVPDTVKPKGAVTSGGAGVQIGDFVVTPKR